MIDAFDASLASDYGTKQRQLFAAETLTGSRRRANRTMILHQQDRTVLPLDTLRHIALLASNFRQRLGAGQQACASFFHPPRVRVFLTPCAFVTEALQPAFAKCCAYGADHFKRQLSVAIGEA